ncbi:MAG: FKBP-type peptidyl-prolyl cis-trans isomerase [Nanoarchaeota archaeon]
MVETDIVKSGHLVKLHYTGTFDDGSVFDSSEGKDPLEVLAGKGMLIKGFDNALVGMKVGEEKSIDLTPEDGYGHPRDDLVQEISKKDLGDGITPEVGMTLGVTAPNGQVFPAVIKEVKDDSILLDANHPLAGKNINFKVKVEETREPTEEDMKKFTQQPQQPSESEDQSEDKSETQSDDSNK